MPLSYQVMILSPVTDEPVHLWDVPHTFSLSFDCSCPNLFEKCYWYQIQNRHIFTNISVDEVKHGTHCLCSVFQGLANYHALFYLCHTRHCNFFGIRIVLKSLIYARNDGFPVVPFAVFSSNLMPVSNEMPGLQNTH